LNTKTKKILINIIPIAIGIGFIWYFLAQLTDQDKSDILTSFKTANYWWVGLSLCFGVLSHLSRAYRWHFMLEPLGFAPKFANSVMSVMIAYLLNLGVPKAGEFARAAAISEYENIPIDKAIGTIVAERIADIIMLLFIIMTGLILQYELIASYLFKDGSNPYFKFGILAILGLLGLLGYWLIRKSNHPYLVKISRFTDGIIDGAKSILTMKKKWAFIFHTLFIWTMYILMFYVVTFAIPETSNLPIQAIIVGFVAGALSMALTNGGLGSYPYFVAAAFVLYFVDENSAKAFGWIMWSSQTLMILIFGGLSFLFLPIYNRKRKHAIL